MDVQLINKEQLSELHQRAKESERLRQNFDLRTTTEDTSQRMLNALEPGTRVPIHRHLKTSESVICLEGCLDWVFYEELPNMDAFRVCPREKIFGIQVPLGAWHSIEVHEPSTIFEAKDGKYGK